MIIKTDTSEYVSEKRNYVVKTKNYEFMGPVGTFVLSLGLPAVVFCLYAFCNAQHCGLSLPPSFPCRQSFWNPHAYAIVIAWFVFHAIIYMSPLGERVKGTVLRDGSRLSYNINGVHAFVISHAVFVALYVFGVRVTMVYDRFLALASAAFLLSFVLAIYLYFKSFDRGAMLALGGNSGHLVYDWFMGRELNPRVGNFDWKVFCEMRPGLIGWVMINYCMMAKQYELHGTVTGSMLLVCIFQTWYVLDSLIFEEAILTTMDIVHDGFGFMLAFGDLCWVPFTYSLQARFLVDNPTELSPVSAFLIVVLQTIGYCLFRASNSEKDQFRRDPNHPSVRHLKTMLTRRGTKLIVSGWWGFCRHPNYLGDLTMALAWSLPCGFNYILPYFYVSYFTVLLLHRQMRDEHHCRKKYGDEDWNKFCRRVRWRLLPGVY